MRKRTAALGAVLLAAALASTATLAKPYRPLALTPASTLGAGETRAHGALSGQWGREASGERDYHALGIGPVGIRHGAQEDWEYGGYVAFVNNVEDNADATPDDSGLEGITGFAKLALNEHTALAVGARVGGSDDIAPYPSDGLDLYVRLPMQRPLGDGLAYGAIGYTVQEELEDPAYGYGGNYANWGVGYAHPMDTGTNLNLELRGDESAPGDRNHMELLLGGGFQMDTAHVRPYLGLGLYDASPDIAVGISASAPL